VTLYERHPLPPGWQRPEAFVDQLTIGRSTVLMCGLQARHENGGEVVGSAAGVEPPVSARAYFELVERATTVSAALRRGPWLTLPRANIASRRLSHESVFPKSYEPTRWQYSRSNGVAVHPIEFEACRRAALELLERDAVLRSWFGGEAPVRLQAASQLEELLPNYEVALWSFPARPIAIDSEEEPVSVVGCFAFPTTTELATSIGFAAGSNQEDAIKRAVGECLQRLAFLWGEPIESDPACAPNPNFHQEYYLHSSRIETLRRWLDGAHCENSSTAPAGRIECDFVDLEQDAERSSGLHVIKAISKDAFPLVFGDVGRALNKRVREGPPHPIA
jgi:hypothetical protein